MPPQPDLKAETKEIAATLGLARKKALNFALLIAKKGLVLEVDPRKPVETLRTAARKKGGGKGAWGRMRCEGAKLTLTSEAEPPGNLQQLAKKFFSERGQTLQIEIALAAAEAEAAPGGEAPVEAEAPPEEEEPSEIDVGALLQKARKKPFNVAWLIGQGELVLRAHPRKPLDKLLQEAKQGGGGPRGALGAMTVSGKTITLTCEEAPPDAFPRLAKKWLADQDFAYKVRIALPGGGVLDSDEEEAAPGEPAQSEIEAKLGRAFTTLTAEIKSKKPLMSPTEQQAAATLLQTYADSISTENPARALKTLKAMRTLLDRVAQPAAQAAPEPEPTPTPKAPPPDEKITFVKGAVTGQRLATQDGNPINALLRASKDFGSQDEAIAYARSLKGAAAARIENGFFAVYRAEIDSMPIFGADLELGDAANDDSEDANDTTIKRVDTGLVAIITEDDYIIRTESGGGVIDRSGSPLGPFEGPIQAFGVGMEKLKDKEAFEEQFELVMRDTAFAAIDSAEQAAQDMRAKLEKPLGAGERATLGKVLEDLDPVNKQLADKEQALLLAKAQVYSGYAELLTMFANPLTIPSFMLKNLILSGEPVDMKEEEKARLAELEKEVAGLKIKRSELARDFPLALRIEDPEEFRKLSQEEQDDMLREMADGVLEDIETTRENIEDGDFDFWTMPGVRETAIAGMGLGGDQLDWARDRAGWEQSKDTAWAVGEAVVTIGLAVGAVFATGGLALALGGGALLAGGYSAYDVTEEYFRKGSAADIALDPSKGLVPPEDVPHWGWVAASWIGLGFDAAAVRSAVKALKAGKELAEAARILGVPASKIDDVLRPALEGKKAASSFKATMAGENAFDARFGTTMSEAATVITRNPKGGFDVEVVVRAGADPAVRQAAVLEEMRHLQQLSDPAFADDVARLTEDALADWATKNPVEKMETLRSQLRLEADSQSRLLGELKELLKKAPDQNTRSAIMDQIDQATHDLAAYSEKLSDVEKALPGGKVPPHLDLDAPPRLFNTSQELSTNDAALKALNGIDEVPEGYFFARHGEGFQLRRKRATIQAGEPKKQIFWDGKKWGIRDVDTGRTTAEKRASILNEFKSKTGVDSIDTPIEALTHPYKKAYTRKFKDSLEALEEYGVDPADIIKAADEAAVAKSGKVSLNKFEEALRRSIRDKLVEKIGALPPKKQSDALAAALDAMPDNGSKGALFSAFRARNMGADLKIVKPKKGGTTLKGTTRQGDGLVEVVGKADDLPGTRPNGGGKGPKEAGDYLVEDKSSAGAFKKTQLKTYSEQLVDPGYIETASGRKLKGVTYFFPDNKAAKAALSELKKGGYSDKIHVAYYRNGELKWLR